MADRTEPELNVKVQTRLFMVSKSQYHQIKIKKINTPTVLLFFYREAHLLAERREDGEYNQRRAGGEGCPAFHIYSGSDPTAASLQADCYACMTLQSRQRKAETEDWGREEAKETARKKVSQEEREGKGSRGQGAPSSLHKGAHCEPPHSFLPSQPPSLPLSHISSTLSLSGLLPWSLLLLLLFFF